MKEKFKVHEQVSLCVFIVNQIPVEHCLPKLEKKKSHFSLI